MHGYKSNAWKKYAKGEDRDTLMLKDWFRDICRKHGYNCETEKEFMVDLHDTNELQPRGTIRTYPVDIYISHRKRPEFEVIVEIDGLYHEGRKDKDAERDHAIASKYGINTRRFDKEALLNGDYTEESIVERLGLA